MKKKDRKRDGYGAMSRRICRFLVIFLVIGLALGCVVRIYADGNGEEYNDSGARPTCYDKTLDNALKINTATPHESENGSELPDEYYDLIDSLPEDVIDFLPNGALSGEVDSLASAAEEMSSIPYLVGVLLDSFGAAVNELLPTLALLLSVVILSALCRSFASSLGGVSEAVTYAVGLCSYCTIAAVSVGVLERLKGYFDSLLSSVSAFVPLVGVLYAAGGNINGATSGTVALSATLAVCQFFFTKTVIPIFCICLSLNLLAVFDGSGGLGGRAIAQSLKKWYMTALSFVMMIMTTAIAAQSILASRADGMAMKGAKFAVGSFIPIVGGTLSSTLSTLASSVELVRGSVGVIGIAVILLLLIPTIVSLAALRGIFALSSFVAGMVGCGSEKGLLDEICSLYGYLEGVAVLSASVFLISFAIFAAMSAAVT